MTKTAVDAFAQARPIDLPFLLLNALFVAAVLVGELFASLRPVTIDLGFRAFTVPAAVLPYAVTLLVVGIVAEVYGSRRSNRVVLAGLFVCAFGAVWLRDLRVAISTQRMVLGALATYLAAQSVAVWTFHLLRGATGGRHLWLRSGVATIAAQLVGSALYVVVTFQGQADWPTERLVATATELWYLKSLLACAGVPICYAVVLLLQRWRARPL